MINLYDFEPMDLRPEMRLDELFLFSYRNTIDIEKISGDRLETILENFAIKTYGCCLLLVSPSISLMLLILHCALLLCTYVWAIPMLSPLPLIHAPSAAPALPSAGRFKSIPIA